MKHTPFGHHSCDIWQENINKYGVGCLLQCASFEHCSRRYGSYNEYYINIRIQYDRNLLLDIIMVQYKKLHHITFLNWGLGSMGLAPNCPIQHRPIFKDIIIQLFCRPENILKNILPVQFECENILQNDVNPTLHCYGYE